MPPNFQKKTNPSKGLLLIGLILTGTLMVLFYRSFDPSLVIFSNDGPLGAQSQNAIRLPSALTGVWSDLNSIGSSSGNFSPGITSFMIWLLGPVLFAKCFVPLVILLLGVGAWFFFRQLKFSPLAAILGGLAAALNSAFFSTACWGVAPQQVAIAMDFFALGLVVSNSSETSVLKHWLRLALAGLCVGMNVMEAADIGAIFSVFIAAFVFYKALVEEGVSVSKKIGAGILRVSVIAVFAGFLATQTVIGLIGSEITGIAGTGQDTETKQQHWDWATQWSMPKKETLGLFVPGLFGYRMDTPKDILPALHDVYVGGNYWGGVGRTPEIDRYFDSGETGSPPSGPGDMMRFSGGGSYAGILVMLLVVWTVAQSFRKKDSAFTETQKRFIWFWAVVMVGSLLMSWGRFAPLFYKLFYALPYASTIRNPTKFVLVLSWAAVILFGYGVHALSRRYLEVPAGNAIALPVRLKNWWAIVRGFDRNWTLGCIAGVIGSVLAWLIYSSEKPNFIRYLQTVGFPDENMAKGIAAFSIGQVGWFVLFFAFAAGLFILVIAGIFSGKRAKLGGILLGALLIVDLGRADLPWIVHWDYKQKYEIGTLNPVVDFLRDKPYEHRVVILPFNLPDQFQLLVELYKIEWAQHLFPYYNIQSLDVVQMPRVPADLEAFEDALHGDPKAVWLITRRWQLTNTRYLLGPAGFLDVMNRQLDPDQQRFRIVRRFNIVPKPDAKDPQHRLEEWTAVLDDSGDYALFEFTGALPRAKLYSNWLVSTNDTATLQTLTDKNFDPQQTVLVSTPLPVAPGMTNQNSGTVEFKSYAPKDIVFNANAAAPSVLLLNDKFDPHWSVRVDGKPAGLLRCNFIMRGVYLAPGGHTVEFRFTLPHKPLYVTLTAMAVGIFLTGLLIFLERKPQLPATK
jgi:hypothetical protein